MDREYSSPAAANRRSPKIPSTAGLLRRWPAHFCSAGFSVRQLVRKWDDLPPGNPALRDRRPVASLGSKVFGLALLHCLLIGALAASGDVLVPAGADWRYLDNGSDQGTAWRQPGFNDASWASGPAQLGYGDGDEATVVSYGPDAGNKYTTTYFRHRFTVTDPSAYTGLSLSVQRDDGVVVYLNGTEVFRDNLPAGTINYATFASSAVGGSSETTFLEAGAEAGLLVAGANVLAVEIHQANPTSSDISFNLQLIGNTGLGTVTRGPYLQIATSHSIILRWRTDTPSDSRVRYGTDPANLDQLATDATTTTEHSVPLTGLQPATRYYYELGSSLGWFTGDANDFFDSAPLPGAPNATRIWAIGDSGTANANAAAVRDAYLALAATQPADVWLMLGDNAYSSGTDAEYQAAVFNMYPTILENTPLWPTRGNHESDVGGSGSTYYNIFTLPTQGEAGGLASGTEAYYSFDYANIHFLCLDSQGSSRSASGAMATWLQNDLNATAQDWVIAYWHHPPYTKGSHNSDTESQLVEMRANLVPLLEDGGVDLVLCGHSHSYERSFLLDGHYGTSSTLTTAMIVDGGDGREDGTGAYRKPEGIVAHQGTVYTVAGSSGKTSGGALNHPAMFISLNELGSVILDVNGNRLDAQFVKADGTVGDYYTVIKETATPTPPAAPTSLNANAASDTQIDLSWTDNANNEVGFKIERSTDGVTFAQSATTGANVTSVSDSGLTPNTTYWYRVRAYNAAGDSPYSNTAQATTPETPVQTTLVPAGAVWQYRDDGSDQGTAWSQPGFDASAWASGPAQLGYGDGDEATVVSYGPNSSDKYRTTYFRHVFTVADPSAWTDLLLRFLRDDGVIIYLNGTEVVRDNMPSGPVDYQTTASAVVGGSAESTFFEASAPAGLLVAGDNVLAAEIHQISGTSSDISFDLELIASGTGGSPTAPAAPTALSATAVSSTQIDLAWTDNANNEDGFRIERSTDGVNFTQLDTTGADVTAYADTTAQPDATYTYRVAAFNAAGDSPYSNTAQAATPPAGTQVTLVPAGAVWQYRDDGSDQGTAWSQPGFDASAWASGPAQLGYGDGDEATVVSYGPNSSDKYRTTYFRHTFTVADPSAWTDLLLRFLRDDGVIIYLNGTEVVRDNLPSGPVDYLTTANSAIGGSAENTFYEASVSPALLVAGANVLAAEIHQANATSSDISFDLELIGTGTGGPPIDQIPPAAVTDLAAGNVTASSVTLQWTAPGDDGSTGTGAVYDVRSSTAPIDEANWDAALLAEGEPTPSLAGTVETFTVGGLAEGTSYYFALKTLDETGNISPLSNLATATTPVMPPAAPSALSATAVSGTQIDLAWTDNANNEDGFRIERSTDGVNFTQLDTTGADVTVYADTAAQPDATYSFRVAAFNAAGDSPYSNTAQATTPGTQPTVVTLIPVPAEDGYIRESSEHSDAGGRVAAGNTGSASLRAGDDKGDRQYKTFLSFDTSVLPDNATILSATLRLKRGKVSGTNPFQTHGECRVDIRSGNGFNDSTALEKADFAAPANAERVAILSNATANGQWSEGGLNAFGRVLIDPAGTTQFRIYFELDDNDDRGKDYIGWYAANNSNAGNRPQLVIEYQ